MTKPGRRWFQFRLRTLFVGVTATAIALVAYRLYVEPYRAQRPTIELVKELGGRFETSGPTPWQRRLLGADHQNLVRVDLADVDDPNKYVPQIARLPVLETLIVGGEKFTDEHLERLAALPRLSELVLDSTSVSASAVDHWRERFPLRTVYESQRRALQGLLHTGPNEGDASHIDVIVGEQPRSEFIGPEHCLRADVFRVTEAARINASIGCLGTLRILDFSQRPSRFDGLAYLPRLRNLTSLNLARTQVSDASLAALEALRQLEELDLSETPITDESMGRLARLGHLKTLDLSETRITDGAMPQLAALPSLTTLRLSRTKITDAGVRALKDASRLKVLDLTNTEVTDASLADLAQAGGLTRLTLCGTQVTGAGLPSLLPLRKLEILDLRATKIVGKEFAPLADFENLMILYDQSDYFTSDWLRSMYKLPPKTGKTTPPEAAADDVAPPQTPPPSPTTPRQPTKPRQPTTP